MAAREYIADFLRLTGCKKINSGANVAVYVSDSDEVFAGSRDINHSRVALRCRYSLTACS